MIRLRSLTQYIYIIIYIYIYNHIYIYISDTGRLSFSAQGHLSSGIGTAKYLWKCTKKTFLIPTSSWTWQHPISCSLSLVQAATRATRQVNCIAPHLTPGRGWPTWPTCIRCGSCKWIGPSMNLGKSSKYGDLSHKIFAYSWDGTPFSYWELYMGEQNRALKNPFERAISIANWRITWNWSSVENSKSVILDSLFVLSIGQYPKQSALTIPKGSSLHTFGHSKKVSFACLSGTCTHTHTYMIPTGISRKFTDQSVSRSQLS